MTPPKMCFKLEKYSPEYFNTMRSLVIDAFDRDKVEGVKFSLMTEDGVFEFSNLWNREEILKILDEIKNLMST